MRQSLRSLRLLRLTGGRLLCAVATVRLVDKLMPTAAAVAIQLLVARVASAATSGEPEILLLPLTVIATILLVWHAVSAALDPISYLARQRIDGAHRAAVMRLVATGGTIDRLERPATQRLIRSARADPESFSERTPGQAALAQYDQLAEAVGLFASGLVLAQFSWWLVALLVPSLLCVWLRNRHGWAFVQGWKRGLPEIVRAGHWQDALGSAAMGKEVRVFGLGTWMVRRIRRHLVARSELNWASWQRNVARQWQFLVLSVVPLAAAFILVAVQIARGETSVATATAALTVGASLFMRLDSIDNLFSRQLGSQVLDAYDQLSDLFRERPHERMPAVHRIADERLLVRFEKVGFTYPGMSRAVLDGLDLEIRPGELLAVVGLNGAGKSTLIKLLGGLYQPDSGRIVVGSGAKSPSIQDVRAWRAHISVVFQDFVKYELSLADNVALGRPGIPVDLAAMEAAAREAGLHQVLERLPQGWDTPLARSRTGGVDLSGGQWQQVVLTRALYALHTGASLLVLDEPTSHLDVRSEFEVFQRLGEQRRTAGVVLISHRLSTVRHADRIVMLDGGRITESGTHEELITLDGDYAKLFALQAERFQQGYRDSVEDGQYR